MKMPFWNTASPATDKPREQLTTKIVTDLLIFIAVIAIIGTLLNGTLTWVLVITHPAAPRAPRQPSILPHTNTDLSLPLSGKLALDDPLSNNNRGYGWQEFPPNSLGASCQFIGNSYHVISQDYYVPCHTALQASNFILEVHMQIIKGNCGGLSLRDTISVAHAYNFEVCQNGLYRFNRFDNFQDEITVASGSSKAIITGLGQSNVVAAVVNGDTFNLYVNNQKITTINDSLYSQGQFGVSAFLNTEAAYTNARMWALMG